MYGTASSGKLMICASITSMIVIIASMGYIRIAILMFSNTIYVMIRYLYRTMRQTSLHSQIWYVTLTVCLFQTIQYTPMSMM